MAENVFAVSQTDCSQPAKTLAVDPDAFLGGTIAPPRAGKPSLTLSSCGRVIDGVRIEIRDSSGALAAPGKIGEIHVSSPFLFSGYYLQPDITKMKLRDGWYATGDMGFVHADELYVAGRVDDMLIINGRNYFAHEIEALVNAVPGVIPGRSIALGIDDPVLDATVLVVLVEHRGEPAAVQEMGRSIRACLLEHLGIAAHAVKAMSAGSLVKTTSGKISRVKNKEFYLAGTFENIPVEL
jgi:acyl-CoA synthetase (AMP-forming)/AMP-acid ligase II